MAEEFNMNLTTAALHGGDDYELLFTVPVTLHEKINNIKDVKVIGYITDKEEGKMLQTRDGQCFDLKSQAWVNANSQELGVRSQELGVLITKSPKQCNNYNKAKYITQQCGMDYIFLYF